MRKLLIPLLLASATAATPALAGPDDSDTPRGHEERQQERGEARSERHEASGQMRSERAVEVHTQSNDGPSGVRSLGGGHDVSAARTEGDSSSSARSFGGGHDVSTMRTERDSANGVPGRGGRRVDDSTGMLRAPIGTGQAGEDSSRGPTNWRRHERRASDGPTFGGRDQSSDETAGQETPTAGRRGIEWRRVSTPGSGGLVQPEQPLPRVLRTPAPVVSDTPREGTQPPIRTELARRGSQVHWNTSWRHDRRYDWRNWRRRHHWFFHLGFYYDPFGWSYRPYSVGWRLWPSYYHRRFWINDPWDYRLPYAPPGYRWIRYYNDALLVDTWDGQVVDVIYNFFW